MHVSECLFSTKIQDGCQKWRKLKFFPFVQNSLVIPCGSDIRSISYGFWDIYNFSFSAKFQDGRQKWRKKLKFFLFVEDTPVVPFGSKINSKSLYLLRFLRYICNFLFSAKIQDGHQKWPKLKYSLLHRILLYYPMGQKFTQNCSIS